MHSNSNVLWLTCAPHLKLTLKTYLLKTCTELCGWVCLCVCRCRGKQLNHHPDCEVTFLSPTLDMKSCGPKGAAGAPPPLLVVCGAQQRGRNHNIFQTVEC